MSWLSDIIKGEIAEQSKAEGNAQPADPDAMREMVRDILKTEIKDLIAEEIRSIKPEQPEQIAQPEPEKPANDIDIKSEVRKVLAEQINTIPAKERSLEESYDRVFSS